jgi:epoxyqueuosine reductase
VTDLADFQPKEISDPTRQPGISPTVAETLFLPRLRWLAAMTEPEFREVFRGSPVKRAKWPGLVRNACIALGNWCASEKTLEPALREEISDLLKVLQTSADSLIAESAQWALSRIQGSEIGVRK